MEIFLKNWYNRFLHELPKTKKLRVISPFVKEQVVRRIQGTFDVANFELITRFNLRDFAANVSSLDALAFLVHCGANIYGIKGLHSKVYLFDKRLAIITSANLTNGGLINNHECGIVLSDRKVIEDLNNYFDALKVIGGERLSSEQCEDWRQKLQGLTIENTQLPSFPDYGRSEIEIDSTRRYYVKFLGTGQNRESLAFNVRDEIDRALCHYACGFSRNKKPRKIQTDDVIYLARMTHGPNDYSIFGKAQAVKFVDGRDEATESEILERGWKEDWPIYLRLRNPIFIDGTLGDGVLLYDLIKALDYESFPSTRWKYEQEGMRNINVYRSLSQQAYVELTNTAVEWLEPKFQDAVKRMGVVDGHYLRTLPQPSIVV